MISFTRKEQMVILILVIIIISILGVKLLNNNKKDVEYEDEDLIEDLDVKEEVKPVEEPIKLDSESIKEDIVIHITGAVNKPGIFTLKLGDRVNDAVEAAGGLTLEADETRINLAKRISDEEKIHIYKIGEEEIDNGSSTINETDDNTETNNGKININTATQNELESLSGIGAVKANNIIHYRNNKKFDSIEEIMNVDGVGEKTFENIKERITI